MEEEKVWEVVREADVELLRVEFQLITVKEKLNKAIRRMELLQNQCQQISEDFLKLYE